MEEVTTKEYALENIVSSAVKIPGIKVNRAKFLGSVFAQRAESVDEILDKGSIEAGVSREDLRAIAKRHILKRTSESSAASFLAGIPGGLAMAATIPADIMQFFGMAIRLAQELSYLYGGQDLWEDNKLSEERVRSQLILYIGAMFGVSGAVSGVRVLTTQIAKTTLKKLPQKALTKTFWYPIIKQIGKAIGVRVTKTTVAHGVSKAIPVIGGVISGTLNFATMKPMADRLLEAIDKASFDYSDDELAADIETIEEAQIEPEEEEKPKLKEQLSKGIKVVGGGAAGAINKLKLGIGSKKKTEDMDKTLETIEKLAKLKEEGILSEEEFSAKKKELLGLK